MHRTSSVRQDRSAGRGAVAQMVEHCFLSTPSPASRGPQDEDYRFQIQVSRVRVPPALLSVWSPEPSCGSSGISRSCALVVGWWNRHLAGFRTRHRGFDSRPCLRCPRGATGRRGRLRTGSMQVRILPGVLGSGLSPWPEVCRQKARLGGWNYGRHRRVGGDRS